MENSTPHNYFVIVICFILLCSGIALIVYSFTPTPLFDPKGIRLLGFSFSFFGFGEYLNHPLQATLKMPHETSSKTIKIMHRRRNPCGLGNLFDVLAIITLFTAIAILFPLSNT